MLETMSNPSVALSEPGAFPNVEIERSSVPKGDAIFISTDAAGSPGGLKSQVLERLRVSPKRIPTAKMLAKGYHLLELPSGWLCFVVTIAEQSAAAELAQNLRHALLDKRLRSAMHLWVPLMGTGAGGLTFDESFAIILEALRDTEWVHHSLVRITIASPPDQEWTPAGWRSGASRATPPSTEAGEPEKPLPLSDSTTAALSFAESLSVGRRDQTRRISTRLLLFALAESQSPGAPTPLRADPAAKLFSGALHSQAGEKYREAWVAYFSETFTVPPSFTPGSAQNQTPHVSAVMREAERLSRAHGRGAVELDDVMVSLLESKEGRHRVALEGMGIDPTQLLGEYREALTGQIGKVLFSDLAESTDRLGYERYAVAITDFLTDPATRPPLSISVQSPWGTGKSSLMHQIRELLDPKDSRTHAKAESGKKVSLTLKGVLDFLDRRSSPPSMKSIFARRLWTVWFNAWKYDNSEQVWAGLVNAIIEQVSGRLPRAQRELFLLKLQLARIDDGLVRRRIYERVISVWWSKVRSWMLAALAALAALFGLEHAARDSELLDFARVTAWLQAFPLAIVGVYLLRTYFKTKKEAEAEPARFSLAEFMQVPDYSVTLGNIHHIHEDLRRVLSVVPRAVDSDTVAPLVIFIDDLDRCSPNKVANVVEGVSMLLASDEFRCMFVIGIDPQMIAAALEEAHAKVRDHLPRYERTVPLGWRFMDKFIQLPFTIPPNTPRALKGYVGWLSDTTPPPPPPLAPPGPAHDLVPPPPVPREGSPAGPPGEAAGLGQKKEDTAAAVKEFRESREVGVIIAEAAGATSGNPREIKRIANLARLYLRLRNERRLSEPLWRSPTLSQYARWIVLTLRWPEVLRWLLWGADEATWEERESDASVQMRRLRIMEETAQSTSSADDWASGLGKRLHIPCAEGDWARDPKLYEFFQSEAKANGEQRLSRVIEFW